MSQLLLIALLRGYQWLLSPLLHRLTLIVFGFTFSCRFTPTCSEYFILQIRAHGTITGLQKGWTRFRHCH